LGVILYEMLTGKHPYDAKEQKALFRCHALEPPPPFAERAPDRDIPEAIEAVTMRLLAKDPDERYATAAEVLDALDEALRAPATSGSMRHEADDDSPWTQHAPRPSKSRVWLLAAFVLVTAGAAAMLVPSVRERLLGEPAAPASSPPPATTSLPTPSATADTPATATATASAAPDEPQRPPRPTTVGGLDANAWAVKLQQAVGSKSTDAAAASIQALADIDPDRLGSEALVANVALAVVDITLTPKADTVFERLGSPDAGAAGPDVFYRLVAFHGGSKAARRAQDLLDKPEVMARASKAMRIAYLLHTTPCQQRADLLERAGEEGDRRALLLLSNMTPRDCSSCCLHAPGLGPAIRKIDERTKQAAR
ncbi:MAG: hypothetical protein KC731_25310, partial [Myxococcales bacterium]|nr:hypothetical protein [Myxococcales bacterium]